MFQTEPIKFLQSWSGGWVADFFWLVSQLGYAEFYIPVLILLTFGLSLRRGFLLIQMMLWVGLATQFLKDLFGLPRPSDVDSAVRLIAERIPNPAPFEGLGGEGFWDLPAWEAIDAVRARPGVSFGMPSGHVSGTVTFWTGLALLFRPAALWVAAALMTVLMALSRMVLGLHFLGDVLGGLLLGALVSALAYRLFVRPRARARLLDLVRLRPGASPGQLATLVGLLAAPPLLPALSDAVDVLDAGRLFGLNAAFLVLAWTGLPDDRGSWPQRIGRFAVAGALYSVAAFTAGRFPASFVGAAVPAFVALWGGVRVAGRLGLYVPPGPGNEFV